MLVNGAGFKRFVASLIAAGGIAMVTGCVSSKSSGAGAAQLSGAELYARLCASCHGQDGTGSGPVASALTVRVPDLTRLAWRDGGDYPREDVRRAIDGRLEYRAHGSREMPVWGIRFIDLSRSDRDAERARADAMIEKLVDYLESIQDNKQ
jgi:mono/diheme cytochrome c family protein